MTTSPSSDAIGTAPSESVADHYKSLATYEHHFNSMETELRKLASVWLLAALAAIAYLVRQDVSGALLDARLLIGIVGLAGNAGLLALWILDQLVYHRLLNAVFLLGIRMEYVDPALPPIRTSMMLFSRKRGMARFLRLFYLLPMSALGVVALAAGLWQSIGAAGSSDSGAAALGSVLPGMLAALIPVWVVWRSATLESYPEIAEAFGDPEFVRFLAERDYERLVTRHRMG